MHRKSSCRWNVLARNCACASPASAKSCTRTVYGGLSFLLLDVDGQEHLRVDVASHRKITGSWKRNGYHFPGRLFCRVIIDPIGIDVDLVNEFVLIAESQGIACSNCDLVGMEAAIHLDNCVRLRQGAVRNGGSQNQACHRAANALHRVTTSRCIGARRASRRFCVRNGTPASSIPFCRSSTSALKSWSVRWRPLCASCMVRPLYSHGPPATTQS